MYFDETLTRFLAAFFCPFARLHLDRVFRNFIIHLLIAKAINVIAKAAARLEAPYNRCIRETRKSEQRAMEFNFVTDNNNKLR